MLTKMSSRKSWVEQAVWWLFLYDQVHLQQHAVTECGTVGALHGV